MARYLNAVKRKAYWFDFVSFTLVPKDKNDQVDALTNLGSSSLSGFAAAKPPLGTQVPFRSPPPSFRSCEMGYKNASPLRNRPLATNHVAKSPPSYESSCKSSSSCGITSNQTNSEDVSSEDEWLGSLSLGVKKAGIFKNSQHLVSFWTPRRHPLVISCELLMGNPRLKITLNGKCWVRGPKSRDTSWTQIKWHRCWGPLREHESADTPIGNESVAIDYFSKWVDVEAYDTIKDINVRNFVWQTIVCRFSILRALVFETGIQFNNHIFL
ncbi:hypothetical protein CK203_048880 [Vitis vinifera]|uniref:Uncharacterized protein n=1 Tax=Vitis vinifera TaxID=29760 RepID=A0A438FKX1_VITVI|nr:hypothetical protein CK203_048880 [Vitis vinifera]